MKSTLQRLVTVSAAFSFTVLLGLPVPQLLASAHASSVTNVKWSASASIVYFPIRGDRFDTGLGSPGTADHSAESGSPSSSGQAAAKAASTLGAPTITGVTAGVGSVTVSWSPPTSGGSGFLRYTVQYSTNSGASWTKATTNASGTSYTVTGLSSAQIYIFEVAAVNRSGTGAYSGYSQPISPLPAAVPGAPTITSVTAGVGSVSVKWSAPTNSGGSTITSYAVQYATNGGSLWTTATTSATGTSYTVTGLSSTVSYVFEVAAINSVGMGPFSGPSGAISPSAQSNGIIYHGGPVLVNSVHVYEIWYGDWATSSTPARQGLVGTFLNGIGGSPYFNTNHSYYNASGVYVQNTVSVMGSVGVTGGSTSLNQNSFASIVAGAISSGGLPVDANGVYFVFTSRNVAVSGFLTQYCGFHSAMTVNSSPLQYAFVGDPSGSSLANCAIQTTSSPNGDPAGDAMVSVVAHELSEATTDPQLNAWYSSSGNENGDLCAWNFGTTFNASNGSKANVTWAIGGKSYQYYIQQNWVNASGGYCALSY